MDHVEPAPLPDGFVQIARRQEVMEAVGASNQMEEYPSDLFEVEKPLTPKTPTDPWGEFYIS